MTALLFVLACALYLAGGMARTMLTNVPMNEALAAVRVPADAAAAGAIWSDYSAEWQQWNTARTIVCAGVLLLVGWFSFRRYALYDDVRGTEAREASSG